MPSSDENPLRLKWNAGEPTLGGWSEIPSPFAAEVFPEAGFDWVGICWQHPVINFETTATMVQSVSIAGAVPIIRVPSDDPWLIGKALDMGAYGVIVPLINDAAQAERAATACRYPPLGLRSIGGVRSAASIGIDTTKANEQILCFLMIETKRGFENAEAICATAGVDGIFIGQGDMALSLGRPFDEEADPDLIRKIVDVCRHNEIVVGTYCASGEAARRAIEVGMLFPAIGTDRLFIVEAGRREVEAAIGAGPQEPPRAGDGRLVRAILQ
jgi:4-hydroxy-2-oxoheptanedioate aldolase